MVKARGLFLAILLALAPAAVAAAERIVSIGGGITEIVYALGAEQRLVAVDSTSTWPRAADALPDVGYMRRLSAEPILSLRPDLVIAAETSGPESALAQLRDAGVEVALIPDPPTTAGLLAKIAEVGRLVGREDEAAALAERVAGELEAVQAAVGKLAARPRVLFLISAGHGAPMAAGAGTAAQAIIELAGGQNAIAGYAGYKPLSPEAAVAAAPEVVLAMAETAAGIGGPDALLELPEVRLTPAAQAHRVVTMEGLLLLGFGPRTADAVRRLAAALHPGFAPGG
jgi:iron complex transport system substrate-binding protein